MADLHELAARGLGRPDRNIDISEPILRLQSKRVLITGASGEIGHPLTLLMRKAGLHVVPTDIEVAGGPWGCTHLDITDPDEVLRVVTLHDPDIIFNVAASKLAPIGELDPLNVVKINTFGVWNLLNMGRKLVQASTCKAAVPETAYGASKLISERAVLNYGGTVIRYVNVPECGPSMVTIWEKLPQDAPIPVTPNWRYIISLKEALALSLWGMVLPSARYIVDHGPNVSMAEYAERLYPGRPQVYMEPRRGDREVEPPHAPHEDILPSGVPWINRIRSTSDPDYIAPDTTQMDWTARVA